MKITNLLETKIRNAVAEKYKDRIVELQLNIGIIQDEVGKDYESVIESCLQEYPIIEKYIVGRCYGDASAKNILIGYAKERYMYNCTPSQKKRLDVMNTQLQELQNLKQTEIDNLTLQISYEKDFGMVTELFLTYGLKF